MNSKSEMEEKRLSRSPILSHSMKRDALLAVSVSDLLKFIFIHHAYVLGSYLLLPPQATKIAITSAICFFTKASPQDAVVDTGSSWLISTTMRRHVNVTGRQLKASPRTLSLWKILTKLKSSSSIFWRRVRPWLINRMARRRCLTNWPHSGASTRMPITLLGKRLTRLPSPKSDKDGTFVVLIAIRRACSLSNLIARGPLPLFDSMQICFKS